MFSVYTVFTFKQRQEQEKQQHPPEAERSDVHQSNL